MKKRFIALLLMLVLIFPTTAMANRLMCSSCNYMQTVSATDEFEYVNDACHREYFICKYCGARNSIGLAYHYETQEATCTSPAFCDLCKSYHGGKNPDNHSWGDWQDNGDGNHIRYCTFDSSHKQTKTHTGGNATCTTAGTCTDCGASYKNPDNHQGGTSFSYVKDSDTEHEVTVTCEGCKKTINTYKENHTETTAATCTTAAYCAVCISNYGSTASNNHVGETTTTYVKSSETQHTAKITYAVCQHTVDGESTAHTETTASTCTTAAYCDVCKSYYGEPDPNAHDLESHDGQAATCTEDGWEAYEVCQREGCGYTTYQVIPLLKHDLVQHNAKAPTCTSIGWNAYQTCSRCSYSTYAAKVALGHDKVQHTAKAPTCTDIGWDAYVTCSRCSYSTYAEKSALGHDKVQHTAKEPTCTAIGWDAYVTCSRCDYSTYAEKSALGHDRVQHTAKEPTCTTIGWAAYETCSRCDYSTYAEKSALGHDIVKHDAKAPTCTEIGWDAYDTCSRCDYTTYAEQAALGHALVKHDAKAPTCTQIGWDAYDTCSRCDDSTYAEKSALGHDIVKHDAKAPTCTDIGWDAYDTCSRCDYTTYAKQAAVGHWYAEWISNGDATHTAPCKRGCGYQKTNDCTPITFALPMGNVRMAYILCPVCGGGSNGTRLVLVEGATARAVTRTLPGGELLVRMGTLDDGQTIMIVAFEHGGMLTQPTGRVRITLPAELLDGYSLYLLAEDGTDTELTLDVREEEVSFVLDFTDSQSPMRVLRLVPVA